MNRLFGYDDGRWCAYFYFVGWWAISLGAHISLRDPNIEIHIPFGFIRMGRLKKFDADFVAVAKPQTTN